MKFRECLILLSISAFSVQAQEEFIPFDTKALMDEAISKNRELSFEKQLELMRSQDISEYNIDGLQEVIKQAAVSENSILEMKKAIDVSGRLNGSPEMISGYANKQEALDREKILSFMGLSETRNHLYVFVSYSMPEDMIRAYAREALWSGATLIIKGFEQGETFKDFMRDKGLKLINNQGLTASLQIDPKLFESFAVDYVPTIVLSKEDYTSFCEPSGVKLHASNVTEKCKERPSDSYVKISGSVTLDYALEQFEQTTGFEVHARERMDALRENIGKPKDNEEQVAEYNFDDTLLPHQKEAIYEEYSKFGTVVETEKGLSVIPFSPPQSVGVHFKRHEGK